MRMRRLAAFFLSIVFAGIAQETALPYREADLIMPAQAASHMKGVLLLHVGFPVLYRASHIQGSVYAGPGSKPEGAEELKKAVAHLDHDREILIYCGCCPWENCPNVRPALKTLHDMGFRKVRAIVIPANFKVDWSDKGYPTEKRGE